MRKHKRSVVGSDKTAQKVAFLCEHIAFMSVVDATINAILPNILTDTIGLIADLRFASLGDIVKFKIMPNQFFTVSKGNYRPAC